MAFVELRDPAPVVRRRRRARRHQHLARGGRVRLAARAVAAAARRPRCGIVAGFDRPTSGRILVDGQGHDARPAQQARHGDGLPGVQPLPEHDRGAERRVRAARSAARRRRSGATQGRGAARARRPRPRRRALSAPALGRDAAAGRARPRARDRAARAPARRAALGARRQGARAAARGDQADPEPARDHDASTSRTTRRRRSRSPTGSRCSRRVGSSRSARPAEIYGAPSTPFVAEFVGTMNRLEATVADPQRARSTTAGCGSRSTRVRGRSAGERVLVLVRPETVELGPAANGAAAHGRGDLAHVPRPRDAAEGDARRGRDDRRRLRPPAPTRTPSACASGWASPSRERPPAQPLTSASSSSGRSVKIPSTPSSDELAHAPLVVDRVDGRLQARAAEPARARDGRARGSQKPAPHA